MLHEYQNSHIYQNYISAILFSCFDFVVYYAEQMTQSVVVFPHHHNLYEIYYGMEGTVNFSCDGTIVPLQPDDVIFVGKNQMHHIQYDPQRSASYFVLIFNIVPKMGISSVEAELEYGELTESLAYIDKKKFLHTTCNTSYQPMLNHVQTEIRNHQIGWDSIVSSMFYHLFVHLLREVIPAQSKVQTSSGYKNIALTASKYIHSNYMDEITIDMVAKQLNVTPRHINRLFQDLFGKSFAHTVNLVRMEYAKQYLITTNDSIERIASLVGLPSGKVLTKLFKENNGVSPAVYRAANWHRSADKKLDSIPNREPLSHLHNKSASRSTRKI